MKKSFVLMVAAFMLSAVCGGMLRAEDAQKPVSEQEIAAFEANLFIPVDSLNSANDAKFSEALLADSDNDDAKCWFWCYSYPQYYYYPAYYYYSWYCPWYYVNFRLVTYTVPVAAAVTTTTTTVTTETAEDKQELEEEVQTIEVSAKSSGKTAMGVVVDQKVTEQSPLYKKGIRSGDIITKIDGKPVRSLMDVKQIKTNSKITVVRGEKIRVADKQILQKTNGQSAAKGCDEMVVNTNDIKDAQDKTISLYEYYDKIEAEDAE